MGQGRTAQTLDTLFGSRYLLLTFIKYIKLDSFQMHYPPNNPVQHYWDIEAQRNEETCSDHKATSGVIILTVSSHFLVLRDQRKKGFAKIQRSGDSSCWEGRALWQPTERMGERVCAHLLGRSSLKVGLVHQLPCGFGPERLHPDPLWPRARHYERGRKQKCAAIWPAN